MIALVVAVGGTSYAALKLPKNSVGTKQLKKNAVTSVKVKDGSLKSGDFGSGQLPKGEKGDNGKDGQNGQNGPGAVKINVALSNGQQSDLAVGKGYTLRFVCSGAPAAREFSLFASGSGGAELAGVKSIDDDGSNPGSYTNGVSVSANAFQVLAIVGKNAPDPSATTNHFFRLGGTSVLHGTSVVTVAFDMFLDDRTGQNGACRFDGTATPAD